MNAGRSQMPIAFSPFQGLGAEVFGPFQGQREYGAGRPQIHSRPRDCKRKAPAQSATFA